MTRASLHLESHYEPVRISRIGGLLRSATECIEDRAAGRSHEKHVSISIEVDAVSDLQARASQVGEVSEPRRARLRRIQLQRERVQAFVPRRLQSVDAGCEAVGKRQAPQVQIARLIELHIKPDTAFFAPQISP